MPIVQIKLLAGRTDEQKQKLADAIAQAMSDIVGSTKSAVHVVYEDTSHNNWYQGGKTFD
jgi:4-oxalocrotonate tautomerase